MLVYTHIYSCSVSTHNTHILFPSTTSHKGYWGSLQRGLSLELGQKIYKMSLECSNSTESKKVLKKQTNATKIHCDGTQKPQEKFPMAKAGAI